MNTEQLIDEWREADRALKHYKKLENDLRIKVTQALFPNATEGTETTYLNQLEIKATFRLNYKLNLEEYEINKEFFSESEKACIKIKPTLSLTDYRNIAEDDRPMLDECIIVTPGLPSLKIEEDTYEDWRDNHEG